MKEPDEVLEYFGVCENTGLTSEQFKKNLAKYGPNGEAKLLVDGQIKRP